MRTRRAQPWMDGLGDWTWPGQAPAAAVEAQPPAWVPALPPAADSGAPALPERSRGARLRRLTIALLLLCVAGLSLALALQGRLLPHHSQPVASARRAASATPIGPLQTLPPLQHVRTDSAGSSIDLASYRSVALRHAGSFLVYLPPAYRPSGTRYPVLYLLHGNSQPATAFLKVGLQQTLDHLIASHRIPPLIAVMVEGGQGSDNWRNIDGLNYESYVLEVQALVDRMLPTIAKRSGRSIAGDSMGGYGAMNVALGNPYRFGSVESWIGFFNGLEGQLKIDRPVIRHLGLHAFVYGAAEDTIANPAEDAPFAAQLRASGASAESAIYPGEHSLETVEAHLSSMLTMAGRWLGEGEARSGGS